MTLVGALILVVVSLAGARGADSAVSLRLGYRSLLLLALPAWIVMRLAGEWTASNEGLTDLDSPPDWLDIGYVTAEPSFLLLIVATVLAGIGARRAATADSRPTGRLGGIATALVALALLLYVVAIWAMTTKPV